MSIDKYIITKRTECGWCHKTAYSLTTCGNCNDTRYVDTAVDADEWLLDRLAKLRCPLCDKAIEWNDNIPAEWEPTNPDYYTHEGFFALLDGLRAKELHVIIDCDPRVKDKSEVAIYDGSVLVACALDPDLPTALVEAAIQAMEASDG